MGLFIRTIGIARATTKIGMANLVYNIKRFIFLHQIAILHDQLVLRKGDPFNHISPVRSERLNQ